VLRGGSFNNNQNNARCANRNRNNPNIRNNNIGCRVAVSHIFLSLPAMPRVGPPWGGWMRGRGTKKWRGLSASRGKQFPFKIIQGGRLAGALRDAGRI
jgi:hypothetical protein